MVSFSSSNSSSHCRTLSSSFGSKSISNSGSVPVLYGGSYDSQEKSNLWCLRLEEAYMREAGLTLYLRHDWSEIQPKYNAFETRWLPNQLSLLYHMDS